MDEGEGERRSKLSAASFAAQPAAALREAEPAHPPADLAFQRIAHFNDTDGDVLGFSNILTISSLYKPFAFAAIRDDTDNAMLPSIQPDRARSPSARCLLHFVPVSTPPG